MFPCRSDHIITCTSSSEVRLQGQALRDHLTPTPLRDGRCTFRFPYRLGSGLSVLEFP